MTFDTFVNARLVPFIDLAIIPLLYAIAFLIFLIGIVRFFFAEGDEERKKGRFFVVWGIVGMVVLFSVWGMVQLLLSVLIGI